jgi:lipopolysaccharide assembly outer membrane protein LptD (OstA)
MMGGESFNPALDGWILEYDVLHCISEKQLGKRMKFVNGITKEVSIEEDVTLTQGECQYFESTDVLNQKPFEFIIVNGLFLRSLIKGDSILCNIEPVLVLPYVLYKLQDHRNILLNLSI